MRLSFPLFPCACWIAFFCGYARAADADAKRDWHSYANAEHVRVRHLDLDLEILFDRREIRGEVALTVERTSADMKQPLVLDTRGLTIESAEVSEDGKSFQAAPFEFGREDKTLGRPLTIQLPPKGRTVRIKYHTGPRAAALQWLDPAQTAGKKHPFLFTQSEAIDARSWIPLQDSPAVRITYTARVRTPKELLAVMSASNDGAQKRTGDYRFEMKQAIPSYLLALAVGDLEFRKIGPRTGIYAEPKLAARAAAEFSELEEMMRAAEKQYGPYRWGRYDVLIMPPSFPFGGMENPRLTFASPTVLAGDKSLVSLLAHELAHSWSGNLVSNATWRDFWLNEGFTVYIERRIMESVYGKERARAEAVLGRRQLNRTLPTLSKAAQILHVDLTSQPPDNALTDVAYEKGCLFLTHLEAVYGREKLDEFLKGYFDHFAFKSITTGEFADYLDEHLLKQDPQKARRAKADEWLYKPSLPDDAPDPTAAALEKVETIVRGFESGQIKATQLPGKTWTPQEWIHFLTTATALNKTRMQELDAEFAVTKTGNSEVLFQWLLLAIQHGFEPAYPRVEEFLTEQGRRKFISPIYAELMKTTPGKERALAIYRKARPTYHPLAIETVDQIVEWKETP
jgi:leukotriene-A4 hydrolase